MKTDNTFLKLDYRLLETFNLTEAGLISLCLSFEAANKTLFKTNAEIGKQLNIPIATLNRLIKTLVDGGYIIKDRVTIKAFQNRKALVTTNKLRVLLGEEPEEVIETIEIAEETSNEVIEDNDTNTPDSDFNPLDALKPFYNGDSEKVMDYIKSVAPAYYDLEDAEDFKWSFEELDKHQFSKKLGLKKLTSVTNNIIV
tara:strand:+ start:63 stop:656 length:594 start_codon:yes stop_codon:yes gene_type:complete